MLKTKQLKKAKKLLKNFVCIWKSLLYLHPLSSNVSIFIGGMAEWSIAAVLKTVDCYRSGGSNPSSSAYKTSNFIKSP